MIKLPKPPPTYVFFAGPMLGGKDTNPFENVQSALMQVYYLEVNARKERLSVAFYVPHERCFRAMAQWQPRKHWIELDNAWLAKCDCVYRIGGESQGADAEEALAHKLHLPVFYTSDKLFEFVAQREAKWLESTTTKE